MDEEINMLEFLLENNIIEVVGVNEDGETSYQLTENWQKKYPEFIMDHISAISNSIFRIWHQDFIEVYFDDNGSPLIEITDASYAAINNNLIDCQDDRDVLIELIKMWEIKEKEEE